MHLLRFVPRLASPPPHRAALLSMPLLALVVTLLSSHASLIRKVKETGLPAAVTIPALERRLNIVQEQIDVLELEKAVAQGSEDEIVATYILPEAPELPRVLALFDALRGHFEEAGQLRNMSAIQAGAAEATTIPGVRAHPFTFEVDLTEEGARGFLRVLRLTGLLTVSDALTAEEAQRLLRMTEEEDPTSVASMERFLAIPILAYVREPKPFEEQVLRSFTSPSFEQSFTGLLRHSALDVAHSLFGGGLGQRLADQKLWPVRLLTVDRAALRQLPDGWFHASFTVRAYARSS